MTVPVRLGNAITRRLEAMFPGFFGEAKHNHYADFGFPTTLGFPQFHAMYARNGIARAAVDKTAGKTWEDTPELWEVTDPEETSLEAEIRQRLADLRFWQRLAEADRRSLVGGYAGVILRLADNQRLNQPVTRVGGGLMGLVEVIPVWAEQLTVSTWNTDDTSPGYGRATMYRFVEAAVGNGGAGRQFDVHPDRVIIWSDTGDLDATSPLEPGFNDLMTMEKVVGAGGEGFWKNAKSAPVLSVDKDARLADMAAAMGVPVTEIADAMNAQVGDFQKGFDKLLMIQGMKAETLSVSLPSPEHFFGVACQSFAASWGIPMKVLLGSQTGERASTEDAQEWSRTIKSRREKSAAPSVMEMVRRLERFGVIPERDWTLHWPDPTEASMGEKIARAKGMADINAALTATGELAFLPEELRAVVGYAPIATREEDDE